MEYDEIGKRNKELERIFRKLKKNMKESFKIGKEQK